MIGRRQTELLIVGARHTDLAWLTIVQIEADSQPAIFGIVERAGRGSGVAKARRGKCTDAGLARIETLGNLTNLNLSETKVTDAGLSHLERLTRLEIVFLNGDDVTDAGLAHLEPLTGITGLFLSSTKVSKDGLVHLKRMGRLTKLNVSKTAVTDQGLADAKRFLPFWIKIEKDQP